MNGMAPHLWSIDDSLDPVPTFRCVHCSLEVTVMRPVDNFRPTDDELRSHCLPTRCRVGTVSEVMRS